MSATQFITNYLETHYSGLSSNPEKYAFLRDAAMEMRLNYPEIPDEKLAEFIDAKAANFERMISH